MTGTGEDKINRSDCNRAFRDYFDKAQLSTNRDEADFALPAKDWQSCP